MSPSSLCSLAAFEGVDVAPKRLPVEFEQALEDMVGNHTLDVVRDVHVDVVDRSPLHLSYTFSTMDANDSTEAALIVAASYFS